MTLSVDVIKWVDGKSEGWTYEFEKHSPHLIVFELSRLPNFAEPRFSDLGSNLEDRKAEVARRQLQMLRQIHALGSNFGLSLRLRKEQNRLRLFIVVRTDLHGEVKIEQLSQRVSNLFPKEYHLQHITPENSQNWQLATDLSFTQYIDTIFKPEEQHRANTWPYFYLANLWQSQATNDLETLCRTLLRFSGEATIDITLVPTDWGKNERDWVDQSIKVMRQALNGERLLSSNDGKVLKVFEPIPSLRSPVENYESLMKRYDQSRLFLYSFRVFASDEPFSITQALISSATRSKAQVKTLKKEQTGFRKELRSANAVDINPDTLPDWWLSTSSLPYRAQRLHRLVDIEEVASFWRFPIPVRAGFPGFDLDTGDERPDTGARRIVSSMKLGVFTDDAAQKGIQADFNIQGLAKHGLIVGVPGSGKTTTMFNLLQQLWVRESKEDKIPFIVLEPAKTEYRALKTISGFTDDLLVFTLGDERTSPFRFNPFEVPNGIPVESHISRLNACFVGAFSLFDPLPLLLDKAIRLTYEVNGWYDDSIGGESGLVTPTLSDLVQQAEVVINSSGYSDKLRDDFNAALLQRLESLRRGSKGRMLDTRESVPFDLLMNSPVVLELDSLNEDEKALMMMFILTFVYEYAKANRRSGSPLRHVLVVEEAHNLIGASGNSSEFRANPKEIAIRLFTRMLAEMRALGQGILIADQLPTALAPEAVKQTNLKVLMRMTARDDREEIGNTMDLDEAALKAVTRFKSGQALVYIEEWDRVRQIQTPNFKSIYQVEEPPDDSELSGEMSQFEEAQPTLFMPFVECTFGCKRCNRRVRSQAEQFIRPLIGKGRNNISYFVQSGSSIYGTVCKTFKAKVVQEAMKLREKYSYVDSVLPFCAYVHLVNWSPENISDCQRSMQDCTCKSTGYENWFKVMLEIGDKVNSVD
ncbi:MAG: ATP-binding protein [Anaerolineae bacterium]|nr:ATP-binding protein [Anaerolineae bacterium]